MPSVLHPQAKFDPIPPDLDLSALVEETPNFDYVIRISTDQIHELGLHDFEKLVLLHVIIGGKPLVVEGWNKNLPSRLFSPAWLEDNLGKKREDVRDIGNSADMPMTIGHYLNAMGKLTKQWTPTNFRDYKRQRLYLKDIDCPEPWCQYLQNLVPQTLFYLNDCVGEKGDAVALCERNIYDQFVLSKTVGPAGDLMSSLPPEMRAQNIMCYIGHEGTYTPAHREMCASLGQNIMVETSSAENGEKPGSSIWFMTESKDREVVSEYFLSMLGHDIEVESHFAQISAWKKAPFPVYIVEQKVGDFVLIPPLAPHQVWNRGTRTMKVAWNRTTVETLELALHEALPRARMVCRDEQYKCKAIIYYSLKRYYDQLKHVEQVEDLNWNGQVKESPRNDIMFKQLKRDFRRLFTLFTEVLVSEMFSSDLSRESNVEFLPFDSHVTCSYCRCNIFNRFLTCKKCIGVIDETEEEDTYDICMECYTMGRSCACLSDLVWVEQWQWLELTRCYEDWRTMVIANNGYIDNESPPQTLEIARSRSNKKSVAEICQEQLKLRPWKDTSKPEPSLTRELTPEVDDKGFAKRKGLNKQKRRRKESQKGLRYKCHICKTSDWNWKLGVCSSCNTAYCYGTLWRAFDLKPQTVMEDKNWKCPKCLQICSCGKCRKEPSQQAYRPKGTLLGYDTRRVADPRSVESLVDFGRANIFWLRGDGDNDPQTSVRMLNLMEKAQNEKAHKDILDEEVVGGKSNTQIGIGIVSENSGNEMAIDPQLQDLEMRVIVQPHNTDIIPDSISFGGTSVSQKNIGDFSTKWQGKNVKDYSHLQDLLNRHYISPYTPRDIPAATSPVSAPYLLLESTTPTRDKMMGMRYYHQADDPDKILFDHPDVNSQADQALGNSYPRLLVEEPDYPKLTAKKPREEALSIPNTSEIDSAHPGYYLLQREQKLANAKKNGTYFMTRNRLAGGQPLIVRLPMQGASKLLKHLEELDTRQILSRDNPRSQGRELASDEQHSQHNDTIIVHSDVQEQHFPNSEDEGDDQESRVALAILAMKKLKMSLTVSTLAGNTSLPMVKRSGSPEEIVIDAFDDDDDSATSLANTISTVSHSTFPIYQIGEEQPKTPDRSTWTAMNKPSLDHRGHSDQQHKVFSSDRKADGSCSALRPACNTIHKSVSPSSLRSASISSARQASPSSYPQITAPAYSSPNDTLQHILNNSTEQINKPPLIHYYEQLQSNANNDITKRISKTAPDGNSKAFIGNSYNDLLENVTIASSDDALKPPDMCTQRELIRNSFSNSGSLRDEEDIMLTDNNKPLPISAAGKPKGAALRPNLYISEDYLAAKEQALCMVEVELRERFTEFQQPEECHTTCSPLKILNVRNIVSNRGISPVIVKSLPNTSSGKLPSMAKRQTLQGKSFKIVATNSTPSRRQANPCASASTTKGLDSGLPSIKKPSMTIGKHFSSPPGSLSEEASLSDSDDDSIPATRPVTKKRRIETLGSYSGEFKVNKKHVENKPGKCLPRRIAN